MSNTSIQIAANDKRLYRFITLPNKLQATLIHDPDTEKSAACVDVRVGSMCDPENVNGLAHFLEHLLFMGTEKYPEENKVGRMLH
jgi:insulysin